MKNYLLKTLAGIVAAVMCLGVAGVALTGCTAQANSQISLRYVVADTTKTSIIGFQGGGGTISGFSTQMLDKGQTLIYNHGRKG